MYIVAIAWIYVVFMMSITEESVVAGLMTFALYGILPLTIVLYIMGTPQRKRRRAALAAADTPTTGQIPVVVADPADQNPHVGSSHSGGTGENVDSVDSDASAVIDQKRH